MAKFDALVRVAIVAMAAAVGAAAPFAAARCQALTTSSEMGADTPGDVLESIGLFDDNVPRDRLAWHLSPDLMSVLTPYLEAHPEFLNEALWVGRVDRPRIVTSNEIMGITKATVVRRLEYSDHTGATVAYHFVKANGWKIDDIEYGDGESLREILHVANHGPRAQVPASQPSESQPAQALDSHPTVPATDCDSYAAHPADPFRKAAGVLPAQLDAEKVISTCQEALARVPDSPRIEFQLARGYWKKGEFSKAAELTRKAAERDYGIAYYELGLFYMQGAGVPKDETLAFRWFENAAQKGVAAAEAAVGWFYANGRGGIPKDDGTAAIWYKKAADHGNSDGQAALAWLYYSGTDVSINSQQARELVQGAAGQGNVWAVRQLERIAKSTCPEGEGIDSSSFLSEKREGDCRLFCTDRVVFLTSKLECVVIDQITVNRGNCRTQLQVPNPDETYFPLILKFGETVVFRAECNPIEVEIFTDKGKTIVSWSE